MDDKVKNSMKICKEMLEMRKYKILDTLDERMFAQDTNGKRVLIFFCLEKKLNINTIKEYIIVLTDQKIDHAIVVFKEAITSSAKKILTHINKRIELFSSYQLQYNITNHRLYVPHIKMTLEDTNKIQKKLDLRDAALLEPLPVCCHAINKVIKKVGIKL